MAEATPPQKVNVSQSKPNALEGLTRLPVFKQIGLMLGLAASVALGVGVVLWSQTPSYSLLYGNLDGRSTTEVVDALGRAQIAYRLDHRSGALMVPSGQVHEARLKLAAEGLPRGDNVGFEVLDKDPSFGTSQFLEQARYQRALEVELARSISAVNSVQTARVHLALPKQSVFVRNRKKSSASVLVHLYQGRTLEEGQVAAITHLVAASVPNLEPSGVKVVDQTGRMLTPSDESEDGALSRKQFELARRLEEDYIKRIEEILTPIVGAEGVKAQVSVELDFTRTEQTRETFNPDLPALRSEQILEEQGASPAAAGVPGALSNQPPPAGQAPEQAQQPAVAGTAGAGALNNSRRRATRNYELDRTVSHTLMPAATVRRLSVAVVVDHHRTVGPEGTIERKALTPEELNRITALVKEAIGYDLQRGDSVNVTNVPFTSPLPAEPLPEPPLWEQAWLWDLGKQALGLGLVVFLVFAVLRPAARRLTSHAVVARQASIRADGELVEDRLSLTGARLGTPQLPGGRAPQEHLTAVKSLAVEDPKRVAQVVRGWVSGDD